MSGLTPVRPIKLADEDLDPEIRGVLEEFRARLAPYGWIVRAEKVGENLSFQFDNPLSGMSTGISFRPDDPSLRSGNSWRTACSKTPNLRAHSSQYHLAGSDV
jgi:hypothetical protein